MSDEEEVQLSDSGGTVVRIGRRGGAAGDGPGDLDLSPLEDLRRTNLPGPYVAAGGPPYLEPGTVVSWHYAHSVDLLRVVRDDERGLVAWLPSGSEQVVAVATDGRPLRDRPLSERFVTRRRMTTRRWTGPGILRIAPTGAPWSLWYFWEEDGSFEGHYVNLELTHRKPADGAPRTHTRDLVLDLWVADDEIWLKDADELQAAVEAGRFTFEQADLIRAIGGLARHRLIEPWAWPLDEGWEGWRPPPRWDEPLELADVQRPSGP